MTPPMPVRIGGDRSVAVADVVDSALVAHLAWSRPAGAAPGALGRLRAATARALFAGLTG